MERHIKMERVRVHNYPVLFALWHCMLIKSLDKSPAGRSGTNLKLFAYKFKRVRVVGSSRSSASSGRDKHETLMKTKPQLYKMMTLMVNKMKLFNKLGEDDH